MINANELRLVSWVKSKLHNGLETEIFSILSSEKIRLGCNPLAIYDISEIEPIPLSEDWLIRFGFEIQIEVSTQKYYRLDGVEIVYDELDNAYVYKRSLLKFVDIEFVHQLQNLFYVLKLKELQCLS